MGSKALIKLLKLTITLLLLGYVLWASGLFAPEGWQELLATVRDAHLGLLLLSFLFPLWMDFISSVKWHFLSRAIELKSSLRSLFAYYLMGRFFNLVLPSNIGGDIIRIHLQGKLTGKRAQSAAAVFMERYTGLVMLLLLAFLVVWFSSTLDVPYLDLALLATFGGICGITWTIFDQRVARFFQQWSVRFVPKTQVIFDKIHSFRESVKLYTKAPGGLAWAMLNSFVFNFFAIVYVWQAVLCFDLTVPFSVLVVAVPLILVMMNLPISIGSIGLMEFAFTVILGAMGVNPQVALATVLLLRLHTFASAALGGVLYALRHDKAAAELLAHPDQAASKQ